MHARQETRVAIIGRGAIGGPLIEALRAGRVPSHVLECVLARSRRTPWEVTSLAALLERKPDLVIEAAGQEPARQVARQVLAAGCDLMLFSVGALADPDTETALRKATEEPDAGRLLLTAGAVGGFDIIKTLKAAGAIEAVHLRSTTAPQALLQPWMEADQRREIEQARGPVTAFTGSARAACLRFPSVANVSAAVALSSIGFDRVETELVADPSARAKTHEISVRSADSTVSLRIEKAFSPSNPRTSRITPFAAIRWMADQGATVVPGS